MSCDRGRFGAAARPRPGSTHRLYGAVRLSSPPVARAARCRCSTSCSVEAAQHRQRHRRAPPEYASVDRAVLASSSGSLVRTLRTGPTTVGVGWRRPRPAGQAALDLLDVDDVGRSMPTCGRPCAVSSILTATTGRARHRRAARSAGSPAAASASASAWASASGSATGSGVGVRRRASSGWRRGLVVAARAAGQHGPRRPRAMQPGPNRQHDPTSCRRRDAIHASAAGPARGWCRRCRRTAAAARCPARRSSRGIRRPRSVRVSRTASL